MSRQVVVASGYFNPLHYGHVSYLQKAKDIGGTLVVIVNNDEQASRRLGKCPGFETHGMPARDRVKLVRSLACVDCAIEAIDQDESVGETLRLLHPDVFVNGANRTPTESEDIVCQQLGIQVVNGLGIEMVFLQPFTQHYDWGKCRKSSLVSQLTGETSVVSPQISPAAANNDGQGKKFAELWMGDHPSGPSCVKSKCGSKLEKLGEMLMNAPGVLGPKLAGDARLPFLLKVLSIQKALSIQAHPDRDLAARLHRDRPDAYKDPNHKPEIAIALTDFEALCGFRPVSELTELVEALPELQAMVGADAVEALRSTGGNAAKESAALRAAYCHLMHASDAAVEEHVGRLVNRARGTAKDQSVILAAALALVLRLYGEFGNDIGIFSVFFLNIVHMKVGECLYMPQNTPHAYLSGDIVECMACSDNVVRGGLTSKFKDIEVLCEMLRYTGGPPPRIEPVELGSGIHLYTHSELDEFQVTHVHLPAGQQWRSCFSTLGPAMAFALRGNGSVTISGEKDAIEPGAVFFLAAGADVTLQAADKDLHVFVACCPPHYFKN
mmetsp:Transcript_43168/g.92077  ORF Transcript_43168/g.92077 Transcript_43168/m.92077 type:complete len:553 (-) Transcript_43168:39-1697(-)